MFGNRRIQCLWSLNHTRNQKSRYLVLRRIGFDLSFFFKVLSCEERVRILVTAHRNHWLTLLVAYKNVLKLLRHHKKRELLPGFLFFSFDVTYCNIWKPPKLNFLGSLPGPRKLIHPVFLFLSIHCSQVEFILTETTWPLRASLSPSRLLPSMCVCVCVCVCVSERS